MKNAFRRQPTYVSGAGFLQQKWNVVSRRYDQRILVDRFTEAEKLCVTVSCALYYPMVRLAAFQRAVNEHPVKRILEQALVHGEARARLRASRFGTDDWIIVCVQHGSATDSSLSVCNCTIVGSPTTRRSGLSRARPRAKNNVDSHSTLSIASQYETRYPRSVVRSVYRLLFLTWS